MLLGHLKFSFGYSFQIPSENVIASLGKVQVNLYNSIISGSANVVLDITLIKYFGSIGAAIAIHYFFLDICYIFKEIFADPI